MLLKQDVEKALSRTAHMLSNNGVFQQPVKPVGGRSWTCDGSTVSFFAFPCTTRMTVIPLGKVSGLLPPTSCISCFLPTGLPPVPGSETMAHRA